MQKSSTKSVAAAPKLLREAYATLLTDDSYLIGV